MTQSIANSPFSLRAFVLPDDITPLLDLLAEAETADKSGEDVSEETIQAQLAVPHHEPSLDRLVITHPNDATRLIAHNALWTAATADEQIVSEMSLVVHPQWRQKGLGNALLQHSLVRAQKLNAEYVRLYADPQHTPTVQFLLHRGFAPIAAYTEMRSTTSLITSNLPSGFVIKPYAVVQDIPTLVDAFNQSYTGLWGHHQVTSAELEQWLPNLDLNGVFLMFAPDGTVAGMCRAAHHQQRSERNGKATGYIDAPGILPRHRTQRLYQALLAHALDWLSEKAEVFELESWGDSVEILALYQTLGFVTLRQQYAYQRSVPEL